MITSTKDIFYLVLAICILWITTFTCWLLYYAIATARDIRKMKQRIEDTFSSMHSMVQNALAGAGLIRDGVKLAMKFAENRSKKKKTKKRDQDE